MKCGLAENRPKDRRLLLLEDALAGHPHRGAIVEVAPVQSSEHRTGIRGGLEETEDHVRFKRADFDSPCLQLSHLLEPGRKLRSQHKLNEPREQPTGAEGGIHALTELRGGNL